MAAHGFVAVVGARVLPEQVASQVVDVVGLFVGRGWGIGSGGARGADAFALQAVLARGWRAAPGRLCSCPAISVARQALALLEADPWPGNVRELENKVRQAVLLAHDEFIGADDLFLPQTAAPEMVPSFKDAKRQFEKQYISHVLRASRGNISRAARLAQKDRKDFYDVMRRNGIDPRSFRGRSGPDS
jgi:transcriptional regulator with GAF, ATPase, and Fis domain